MREEDGIRYHEEGEKVMTTMEWRKELTSSVDALAYNLDSQCGLVSILAEAMTEDKNNELEQMTDQYDKERLILVKGMHLKEGYSLLL